MSETSGEPLEAPIHNTQRKPDTWDELLDVAQDRFMPEKEYSRQEAAVTAVWERAHTLDGEAYEANRYYGLGLTTCSLLRSIQSEDQRERFITGSTRKLTRGHRLYCKETYFYPRDKGLYVKEIRSPGLVDVPAMRAGCTMLDDAERLVVNTLSVSTPSESSAVSLYPFQVEKVLHEEPALKNVIQNTFGGASILMRTVLRRMDERHRGEKWPDDFATTQFNPPLSEITDDARQLAGLDLRNVAFTAASVRLDELLEIIPDALTLDEAGNPFIDRALIPDTPGPITLQRLGQPILHHTARLRCPALYVAGAIPVVMQSLPEIIARAQEELLSEGYVQRNQRRNPWVRGS